MDDDIIAKEQAGSSRYFITKKLVVGNVSQFIPKEKRDTESSPYCYRWMVYVRGPPGSEDLSTFVKSVRFTLHESYRPYDIVVVDKPPFHLTQYGWGESSIIIKLNFVDSEKNAPFELVYRLKLDPHCTGRQTLGGEKVFNVELDRSSAFREELKFDKSNAATAFDTSEAIAASSVTKCKLPTFPKARTELANLLIKWSYGRPTPTLLFEMAMDLPLSHELLPLSGIQSPAFEAECAQSYSKLEEWSFTKTGKKSVPLPSLAVDYTLGIDAKTRAVILEYRAVVLYNRIQQERIYVQQTLAKQGASEDMQLLPQSLLGLYSLPARNIYAFFTAQALVLTRHLYYDAVLQLRTKDVE